MDEVDGMSGGDRGGVQELINLIKNTRVPIVCIANDYYDKYQIGWALHSYAEFLPGKFQV